METPTTTSKIERQYHPVEVAHLMHVKQKTVQGWLRDPKHPLIGTKIGTQWYISETNLAHFLQGESS